ncbi:MAG: hypothetical protein NTV05_10200 [Acidobacteria bacterium]|nr:hypothetical protein [Acidobacteriota bacterium]
MRSAVCSGLLLVCFSTVLGGTPRQGASADTLMGAAQHLQDVEGNYVEAIKGYQKVLATPGVSRAMAARAQLMVGICHERLGRTEARAAYEVVLSRYSDQKDVAAEALKRLRALLEGFPRPIAGPTLKQVPLTVKADMAGPPSPDGRFVALRDARSGDVVIQDLRNGQFRRITKADPTTLEMNDTGILYSPDGGRVAYVWRNRDASLYELHVFELRSSSDKVVFTRERLNILCWAPDGDSIVLLDYTVGAISSLSLKDGSLKVLNRSERKEIIGRVALSPDGRFLAYDFQAAQSTGSNIVVVPVGAPGEAVVATGEGAKTVCGWSPDGKALYFTSDQSGTTDLFRAGIATGQLAGGPVLVQRDLGKMTPLGISRTGTFFFSRYRHLTDVYLADLDLDSGQLRSGPVHVDSLNIGRSFGPVWSPDGRFLAYHCGMALGSGGPTFVDTLCIKAFDDGTVHKLKLGASIYSALPLTWCCEGKELRARGVNADKKAVTWRFDPDTGRVLGEATASGAVIRYPYDAKTRFARVVVRDADGKETEIYKGQEGERAYVFSTTSDRTWVALRLVPASGGTGTARLVIAARDGSSARELARVESPIVFLSVTFAPGNKYLFSVLSSEDPDVDLVWKIPLDGSPREQVAFMAGKIRDLAVRPDGRQVAFALSQSFLPEVWTLENLAPAVTDQKTPVRKHEE